MHAHVHNTHALVLHCTQTHSTDLASSTWEENPCDLFCGATGISVVLLEILQEFEAGEMVVKIDIIPSDPR